MPERRMSEADDILFRVKSTYAGYTSYYGPYTDVSVARRKRSAENNRWKRYYPDKELETAIEACMPVWKVVEE